MGAACSCGDGRALQGNGLVLNIIVRVGFLELSLTWFEIG